MTPAHRSRPPRDTLLLCPMPCARGDPIAIRAQRAPSDAGSSVRSATSTACPLPPAGWCSPSDLRGAVTVADPRRVSEFPVSGHITSADQLVLPDTACPLSTGLSVGDQAAEQIVSQFPTRPPLANRVQTVPFGVIDQIVERQGSETRGDAGFAAVSTGESDGHADASSRRPPWLASMGMRARARASPRV